MNPHELTAAIRHRVAHHIAPGAAQWYIDERCIDCDADEFWNVVDDVVREHLADQ